MKRGVMNYSITWNQDGEKHEEINFSKIETVYRYLCIMFSKMDVSSLRIWEIYTTPEKPPKDITGTVNKFLS